MNLHPSKRTYLVPCAAVAQGSSASVPAFVVPFDGTIESVTYVASTAITGANTNTRKISLINKGQGGSGTTEMAGLQFNSGTNATAFDETTVTKSGTAANLDAAAGDVVAFSSAAVGTGIADPGGLVKIIYANR